MGDRVVKTAELAELLQVSPRTIHTWVTAGELRTHRTLGGQLRFRLDRLWPEGQAGSDPSRVQVEAHDADTAANETTENAGVIDARPEADHQVLVLDPIRPFDVRVELDLTNFAGDLAAYILLTRHWLDRAGHAEQAQFDLVGGASVSLRVSARTPDQARLHGMVLVKRATRAAQADLGDGYQTVMRDPRVTPAPMGESAEFDGLASSSHRNMVVPRS